MMIWLLVFPSTTPDALMDAFLMINTGDAPDQEHQKLIWFTHSIFQRHTERVCALQLLN